MNASDECVKAFFFYCSIAINVLFLVQTTQYQPDFGTIHLMNVCCGDWYTKTS